MTRAEVDEGVRSRVGILRNATVFEEDRAIVSVDKQPRTPDGRNWWHPLEAAQQRRTWTLSLVPATSGLFGVMQTAQFVFPVIQNLQTISSRSGHKPLGSFFKYSTTLKTKTKQSGIYFRLFISHLRKFQRFPHFRNYTVSMWSVVYRCSCCIVKPYTSFSSH